MGDQPTTRRRTAGSTKEPKGAAKKGRPPVSIRPAAKKIGESDDNLKQRAEWFRQRTTNDKNQE